MSLKEICAKELIQKNKIDLFGTAGAFSDRSFWYYTSLSTLKNILRGKEIWIRTISDMNDTKESSKHTDCKNKIHVLSFSNSKIEKIPMWYLYSGILGQGMRLGFTPGNMLNFIKNIKFVYPVEQDKVLRDKPLILGKDFDIQYGWVFYNRYDREVLLKNEFYNVSDYIESGFENDNYFLKDYVWEYESEFRIVFINRTENIYERIAVDISNFISKLRITRGPEISKEELEKQDWDNDYPISDVKESRIKAKMDLISRNKDDLVRCIDQIIDEKNAPNICEVLHKLKFCKLEKEHQHNE